MARAGLVLAVAAAAAHGQLAWAATGLPGTIYVSAAPQGVNVANGVFEQVAEAHNGKPCFKKEHMQLWLCLDPHGLWSFQPKQFLGTAQGIMVSTQKHAVTPVGAGPWRVWEDGKWAAVEADVSDEPSPDMVPRIAPEELTVNKTIAGLLFGLAVLGVVLASITGSTDEKIRCWAWRMVSAACTFFISFLLVQGLWDLLIQQLFPAPLPRGLGMSEPIKPGIKIITSFSIFSLCFLLLNAVAWKVQYKSSRVMVVKTLGAHLTAIWGVTAFTLIQHEAAFTAAVHFRGDILSSDRVRVVAAFSVVALAWVTFSIYRWASMGLRQEALRLPPVFPWPPSSEVARPAADRSCTSFVTQPAFPSGGAGPSWGHVVNEAEDEAATVVVGFTAAQAVMFCKTGELPGFKSSYTVQQEGVVVFFLGALISLAVLFFVIHAVRQHRGHAGREGKIAQRAVGMCITWIVYRAICWDTRSLFDHNSPLAFAMAAIAMTIVAAISVVVADRLVKRCWRSAPPALSQGAGTSVEESTMRGIMCCVGLVVALAWQFNFEISVMTVVESQDLLSEHVLLSSSLITVLLAVVLALPWRRTILPKSEMREMAHLDDIKYELSSLTDAENFMQ